MNWLQIVPYISIMISHLHFFVSVSISAKQLFAEHWPTLKMQHFFMGSSHQRGFFHPRKKLAHLTNQISGKPKKQGWPITIVRFRQAHGIAKKPKGSVLLWSVKSEEKISSILTFFFKFALKGKTLIYISIEKPMWV